MKIVQGIHVYRDIEVGPMKGTINLQLMHNSWNNNCSIQQHLHGFFCNCGDPTLLSPLSDSTFVNHFLILEFFHHVFTNLKLVSPKLATVSHLTLLLSSLYIHIKMNTTSSSIKHFAFHILPLIALYNILCIFLNPGNGEWIYNSN